MNKEEELTASFRALFDKRAWLDKTEMEERLRGYKPSEVHTIEYIEKLPEPNVTKLAAALYVTRGAVSKLTKRLIAKKLIESYQKEDNKKEIFFRLTQEGREVFDTHEELHKQFRERDKAVFAEITDEQYDMMISFINRYSEHLDAEIEKANIHLN